MSYKLEDISHECGAYFVINRGKGLFEVYKSGISHATRCAVIHYSNDPEKALRLAKVECERRAAV